MNRKIHELLILLKNSMIENEEFVCICREANILRDRGDITISEWINIGTYVNRNEPENANCPYWYKRGLKPPRLKWLDRHIELTRTKKHIWDGMIFKNGPLT